MSSRSRAHNRPSVCLTHYTFAAAIARVRFENMHFDIEIASLLDKLIELDDISIGQKRCEIKTEPQRTMIC